MRLLITGGAGFIGSNFARMIGASKLSGYSEITVLDKLTYAGVRSNLDNLNDFPKFRFVHGDVCDFALVQNLLNTVDAVVNFAAESHVDRSISDSKEFILTNILGVQVLLEAIRTHSRRIRFVQISTDEVYGSIEKGSWTENSAILPNSPYSATKAGGELLASAYQRTYDLDVIITRSSNNYGIHQFPEKMIPLFITNLIDNKKIPIYGSGDNVRDWLSVDDHCRGIHLALLNGIAGQIYNIGGGTELTNIQVAKLILRILGKDEKLIEYVEDRKGHDFRYSIDCSKIQNELGYKSQTLFEDGLLNTINWYTANQNWWRPLRKNQ
jgi:dTDP-glucose 4,6-dehydratase